jgi:hypothetical protein
VKCGVLDVSVNVNLINLLGSTITGDTTGALLSSVEV